RVLFRSWPCAACRSAKQTQHAEAKRSDSGIFGSGPSRATTASTSGDWNRLRSFSSVASPASGSRSSARATRASPSASRAVPAIRRKRHGTRFPWSGTRTAAASMDRRVASSGAGSCSRREGTDWRAFRLVMMAFKAAHRVRTPSHILEVAVDEGHGIIMLGSSSIVPRQEARRGMPPVSIQHPEMTGAVACDPARLLDELKRIAVEQLGAVPAGLYRPIEEPLHENLRGGHEGVNRKDLMTVLALRQRGSGYVMKFRELIGRSFDDFCGLATAALGNAPLGLVRENELEFHLAGQRLDRKSTRLNSSHVK